MIASFATSSLISLQIPLINLPVSSNLKLCKSRWALCPPANPDLLPIVAHDPIPKGFAESDNFS